MDLENVDYITSFHCGFRRIPLEKLVTGDVVFHAKRLKQICVMPYVFTQGDTEMVTVHMREITTCPNSVTSYTELYGRVIPVLVKMETR